MSAISSLSSMNYRPTQGASLQSQAQRSGTTYGSTAPARGGNTANTSAAYCPTCGGGASAARSTSNAASSYCPTCNRAGGAQSNVTSFNSNSAPRSSTPAAASRAGAGHSHQGGQICVACAYQGR